jgi:hypothetical protein
MTKKVRGVSEECEKEMHPTNVYPDINTVTLFAKQRSYRGYKNFVCVLGLNVRSGNGVPTITDICMDTKLALLMAGYYKMGWLLPV